MELPQITQMMMETSHRINKATKEIYKMAKQKAETEYRYRQALAQEIAKLKADNTPVTLIADLARGNVAELKLQRDLADAMFKSAIESLRALQSELSGLQTISKYQDEL
jgi:chorismate mutase